MLEGIIIVVPEALQTFFLGRQAAIALGEDIPPRLIAAVVQAAPRSLRALGNHQDGQRGANEACKPFHRVSFDRLPRKMCRLHPEPKPSAAARTPLSPRFSAP